MTTQARVITAARLVLPCSSMPRPISAGRSSTNATTPVMPMCTATRRSSVGRMLGYRASTHAARAAGQTSSTMVSTMRVDMAPSLTSLGARRRPTQVIRHRTICIVICEENMMEMSASTPLRGNRAYISLGSNLGDSLLTLRQAAAAGGGGGGVGGWGARGRGVGAQAPPPCGLEGAAGVPERRGGTGYDAPA